MATNIVVPDLGESVIEATVARWLKQPGEAVKAGEPVLVLETDKVDLEVAADKSGVLASVVQAVGADVKVGDVLGTIDEVGAEAAAPPKREAQPVEQPAASLPPKEQPQPVAEPVAQANAAKAEAPAQVDGKSAPPEERVTPVAKRLAEENQVDLSQVTSADPRGRITKEDVQRYIDAKQPARPTVSTAIPAPAPVTNGRREERVRMSRRRRTIAQRLLEAQHNAAMLTTFNEVNMAAVMELRQRHKESFKERYGIGLGISSFFVKTAIGALKAFPQLNAEIQGDEIVMKHYYDIGVAIGAEEGLVVPVLRDADRMSFAQIEQAIKDYVQQVEQGKLSLEALRGGTFTITNGGVFGSLLSTPILNPPQVGILGLHKIEDRPIALDGQVVIRPMMYVALSYDHRIVDGREAVQFLVRVKQLVEDPESLLLEG
jgi:2-oxoglutarate dehydrogenase E2 component (dihydrolipoamide succinyltransferase)